MKEEKLESKNVTYKENFRLPRWPVDSVPMIRRLFPEILEEKPKEQSMKDKRYFIEITIKDSDTLEPVRSVSTSSDYPESLFSPPVDHRIASEVNGCLGILFSMPLNRK